MGCLIARRDETHVEAVGRLAIDAPSPVQRDSIFRIASITKPIAAAAAMTLVEECKLRLDEPIDPFVPELADRKVLTRIDEPLDDTVPAARPISLRDLLTCRMGLGAILGDSSSFSPGSGTTPAGASASGSRRAATNSRTRRVGTAGPVATALRCTSTRPKSSSACS